MTREVTNKLYALIDDGMLDKDLVIVSCLKYMSEDEVADMVRENQLFEGVDEDEDEEETEEEDVG